MNTRATIIETPRPKPTLQSLYANYADWKLMSHKWPWDLYKVRNIGNVSPLVMSRAMIAFSAQNSQTEPIYKNVYLNLIVLGIQARTSTSIKTTQFSFYEELPSPNKRIKITD